MKSEFVNGVRIFAPGSRSELIDYALKNRAILVAVNAEKILHADSCSRQIINNNVGYPDGIGAVLSLKKKGLAEVTKIPGCELWLDIVERYNSKLKFYLVGGKPEVIKNTVANLESEYSNLNIVGHRDGYLADEVDEINLVNDIIKQKPDVVFVAMGSPKQEKLMRKLSKAHPALYQGLGGSFDVYTGATKRAPESWVRLNLEWLYRLVKEPTRITRQLHLARFLVRMYSGKL
ncbi:WecB/TagA/CpsF family glycosyltransferase [Vibrio natriegens]|uniref:WecB/TagA/CpsF family glycosyltransferase n=1 Tax=Vibrio natriegens TaxID=691 RepID=UPI003F83756F